MRFFLVIAAATLSFAATESRISNATILAVEHSIDEKFAVRSADPYDVIGPARGTYLEGYGVLFTIDVDLIYAGPINVSPFKQRISPEEIATTRERKLVKLAALRETMRSLLMNASGTLEGLPPNERVAMEAILYTWSWENAKGIPHRVFMSAEKKKLLDAKGAHAGQPELTAIIEEQER